MTIDARIPELSDKELQNLQDNASRLLESGTPAQKSEAERLLPIITAAFESRTVAKAAALRERSAARRETAAATRARKKATAKAEAAPADDDEREDQDEDEVVGIDGQR